VQRRALYLKHKRSRDPSAASTPYIRNTYYALPL
jgi:hypothetical protein